MDIQALAVELISNGAEEYKNFGSLSALYDEYNRLDSRVDDFHIALKELQQQVNNYEEFMIVERGKSTPSDLTLQVLAEQQEVVIHTVGLMYKELSEHLIKMSLLETVVEYVISYVERNEASEEVSVEAEQKDFFASSDLAEVDEDDEEDYDFEDEYGSDLDDEYGVDSDEDYEPEEEDDAVEYENEDGVLLFSLEFNPSMPDHLKSALSEYLQECTKIFVDEIISMQKETDEAAQVEQEEAPTETYDDPYAVVFGSDFGKISGELEVTSPEPAATEDEKITEPVYHSGNGLS